jgi:hypothetical protein
MLAAGDPRPRNVLHRNDYEAGAIDVPGQRVGLQQAHSGHNGFNLWALGPPATGHNHNDRGRLNRSATTFTGCQVARIGNPVVLHNQEHGRAALRCSGPNLLLGRRGLGLDATTDAWGDAGRRSPTATGSCCPQGSRQTLAS